MNIRSFFPILSSLKSYSKKVFASDLNAGLTVSTVLIPQGMAYALLAGVPPIYGLYAGVVPLIIYAIFGTSRQMSIGLVAVPALVVLAGVSQLAEPGTEEYINLAITAAFLIGISQIILSILRLGFLVNFLSYPVLKGFISAAAIIIMASQVKDVFGISVPREANTLESFGYIFYEFDKINWISFIMAISGILLIILFKKISKKLPGALITVIIGTIITFFFKLHDQGIDIIANVPQGLPAFSAPSMNISEIQSLLPTVFAVTIIGVVGTIGIAKAMEAKHKDHTVDANQELFALGISKVAGSFFQCIPTSGSFTRSAVNSDAGAITTVSSIITAITMVLTLLFLTPLLYYLPKPVLSSIILMAIYSLLEFNYAKNLWKTHRKDFVLLMITFLVTIALGIEEGVLLGVLMSIVTVFYKSSKPHTAILGNIDGTPYYRNKERYEDLRCSEDILIMRFDDQLYFGNATYFKEQVQKYIDKAGAINYFLLDASNIHDIDSTGIEVLKEVEENLASMNIELHMCGATGPVRDMLYKSNLMNEPEKHHIHVHEAVLNLHQEQGKYNKEKKPLSLQTNVNKS